MSSRIAHITLLVRDYDEAIRFYRDKLNFIVLEDTVLSETKRWVLLSPSADAQCALLLGKASTEAQLQAIGNQTGGRVFLFLHTDNFLRDYNTFKNNGVVFVRGPVTEPY